MVHPQKRKKKPSIETRAIDSTTEMIDQTIESTMLKGKSRPGHDHRRGEEAETTPSWLLELPLGVKYEVSIVGHRIKEVGSENLSPIHLKDDVEDRSHPDSAIYLVCFFL